MGKMMMAAAAAGKEDVLGSVAADGPFWDKGTHLLGTSVASCLYRCFGCHPPSRSQHAAALH